MAGINAELNLEIANFQNGLKDALGSLRKFSGAAEAEGRKGGKSLFAGIAEVAGGTILADAITGGIQQALQLAQRGVSEMVSGLRNAFELGSSVADTSLQLGVLAGEALVGQKAFENAGQGADDFTSTLLKMQKALGSGSSDSMLSGLGLDPASLRSMSATDAFQVIGGKIASLTEESLQSAAAMELFGKSGGKLKAVFLDGEAFNFAREQLGGQVEILNQSAADFDIAADTLGGVKNKLSGFFVGAGASMVASLAPALAEFNKLDLSGIGRSFGESIGAAITAIRSTFEALDFQSTGELLTSTLSLAIKTAVNTLYAGLMGAIQIIPAAMMGIGQDFVAAISILTTEGFWSGMWAALKGIAYGFAAILYDAAAALTRGFAKIPTLGALGGVAQGLQDTANISGKMSSDEFGNAKVDLTPSFDAASDHLRKRLATITADFKEGFADAGDIFSTKEERKSLTTITDRIKERIAANTTQQAATAAAKPGPSVKGSPLIPEDMGGKAPGAYASALNRIAGRSTNQLIEASNTLLTRIDANTRATTDAVKALAKVPSAPARATPPATFQ